MFKSFFGDNKEVRFSCPEEWWDVIPKPYSARKFIPDWYKSLPMKINNEERLNNNTVKRCVPFLDAMNIGYIIPLAADVWFKSNEDCSGLEWESKFPDPLIRQHGKEQITGGKIANPAAHIPPMKFVSQWVIETPPGWSTLFIPPINRRDNRFECIGGLVDTDKYFNNIQLPFFFTQPNFDSLLKAGTPLVQAIPIKRDDVLSKSKVEKFTNADWKRINKTKLKISSHESYYRDEVAEKK
jgi:hypothetical protein